MLQTKPFASEQKFTHTRDFQSTVESFGKVFHIFHSVESWASERGGMTPLDFEIFSKKGHFLSFEREKLNFATFGPPLKNFEKIS